VRKPSEESTKKSNVSIGVTPWTLQRDSRQPVSHKPIMQHNATPMETRNMPKLMAESGRRHAGERRGTMSPTEAVNHPVNRGWLQPMSPHAIHETNGPNEGTAAQQLENSRIMHSIMSWMETDFPGCYDRNMPNVALINSRKFGASRTACQILGEL
jgi:hypothetical protein